MSTQTIRTALISVSDKTDLIPFAQGLVDCGIQILSTGGTAKTLVENNIPVTEVSEVTQFPEMMAGRIKTLHPRIHGGLLGRRGQDEAIMQEHGIPAIDLLVVNLYPFEETIAKSDCVLSDAIENIDIGGPAMIRAAAKNHAWVSVVVCHTDYQKVLSAIQGDTLSSDIRNQLAAKAFALTARYDAAISGYLQKMYHDEPFPQQLNLSFSQQGTLRYGENPHQDAAFYSEAGYDGLSIAQCTVHQGKALSYNNIADSDAALSTLISFKDPACVIVKHANPSGVSTAPTLLEAYQKAFASDPTSAFGGIIAFNDTVDESLVNTILENQFVEVLLAPDFTENALERAKAKPNVRLLSFGHAKPQSQWHLKRIMGGLLVQTDDAIQQDLADYEVVTERQPTEQERQDAWFVWQVSRHVKSNAIVVGQQGQTYGIGAGQMNRVLSVSLALDQATRYGFTTQGIALASDAFFPFADSIEQAAKAGIRCIIQPGGAMRDKEVIAAADAHGIAMIFTKTRHFKH